MIHKLKLGIELFDFDSLGKDAKENAIDNHRDFEMEVGYAWDDEAIASLKAFVEYFGAKLWNYEIDFSNSGYSHIDINEIPEHTAIELWKLVDLLGEYDKKTLRGTGECLLTGYTADENLIDGARKLIHAEPNSTTKKVIMAGYNNWLKVCQSDYDYQIGDKAITENIIANDYFFDIDGELMDVKQHVKDNKVWKTVLKIAGKEIDITKQLAA